MLLSIILASVLVAILNTNFLHVIAIPHLSTLLYQIKYTTLITVLSSHRFITSSAGVRLSSA